MSLKQRLGKITVFGRALNMFNIQYLNLVNTVCQFQGIVKGRINLSRECTFGLKKESHVHKYFHNRDKNANIPNGYQVTRHVSEGAELYPDNG